MKQENIAPGRGRIVALRSLWNELRKDHALQGWRLVVDEKPQTRLGICRYRERNIGITGWYLRYAPWWMVEDTLRHEVAHVLAGSRAGHGPVWKRWAVLVGARPERCGKEMPPEVEAIRPKTARERGQHKWAGRCACETEHKKARIMRKHMNSYSCKRCKQRITWRERY